MMNEPINMMLVEDHARYRQVLVRILKSHAQIGEILEYASVEVALRDMEYNKDLPRPHLILLDLQLPGMSGLEGIEWFLKMEPRVKIIILTQSFEGDDILTAMTKGAHGYLLKAAKKTQIIDSIASVLEGGTPLDAKVAKHIISRIKTYPLPQEQEKKILSKRETEILLLLAKGKSRKEICQDLDISINTVAYHIEHIFEKLDVINAPAAVYEAYRKGLLPQE